MKGVQFMASQKRWQITSDKFLTSEQVKSLTDYLLERRDLAIARQTNLQAVRDYYTIRALLESGLRVFEFCALTEGDLQGHRLTVRHGKGNKPRTVLLTKATSLMLKEWLSIKVKAGFSTGPMLPMFPSRYDKKYTTRGVQKRIKLIFAALSLPSHLSVHSLRHTYCSLLLASGKVGLPTVKENLGHYSIAVTNLYAHATGDLLDVELYPSASSQKTVLSELHVTTDSKKTSNSVKRFLRKANFK
jgi:integrase/recombinase XerD